MNIALFGGSFNPIHNSHINIINSVSSLPFIDEVWIIPCKNHAFNKELLNPKLRIDMINLSFNSPKIKVSKIEIDSKDKSYTYNTIKALKKKYPKHSFYFVSGTDITNQFHNWYKNKELAKEIEFIIFNRPGKSLNKSCPIKIKKFLDIHNSNVSSTLIRNSIKQNKSIDSLVPPKIKEYITNHNLYK